MTRAALLVALATLVTTTDVGAQPGRPRAEVTPVVETAGAPGTRTRLSLKVRLPKHVHVQAHEPRDPSLIPTVLTVEAPPGLTVERIVYPPAIELTQAGRSETLAVLGPEFSIDVDVTIAKGTSGGDLMLPAVLRYQACDDKVCFAPARATATWSVPVKP